MTESSGLEEPWSRTASELVRVETAPAYSVAIGSGLLDRLPMLLSELTPSKLALVTDQIVAELYSERLDALDWASPIPRYTVAAGEDSKRLGVLEGLLDFLVQSDLDRRSVLVAFGGGVIGDLAGLAASLFMRGIRVVQCPTTLLSMVDSSVGGKTAVNLTGGKNLAGTFHQATAVLADTQLLTTLPRSELNSGLGEVLKTALVGDPELLEYMGQHKQALLALEPSVVDTIVARCVRVKAAVVAADERESGCRKTLNLGHTFAHAIELVAGFGTIPHGVAVATGVCLAVHAAEQAQILQDRALVERVDRSVRAVGLPASLSELRQTSGHALATSDLLEGLRHDKKGSAGEPAFVLPKAAGELLVDQKLDPTLLAQLLS